MTRRILVIEDEENMRWVLKRALEKSGYQVMTLGRGDQAIKFFASSRVDLVLLDLKMPGMDGISVLRELRQLSIDVPILLLTAYASVPTAVDAIKIGATDYLRKPFDLEDILTRISYYLHRKSDPDRSQETDSDPNQPSFHTFIGASPKLHGVTALARTAAETAYTVVIQGEVGSGRQHLAKLIHHNCRLTSEGALVAIDCGHLPLPLLKQELLDTPSDDNQTNEETRYGGRWQSALGGSLLLANVQTLPDSLLSPLVDQLASYLRTPARPHGFRLLLTCTESLPSEWEALSATAIHIQIPPLRQHIDDLSLLLAHFGPDVVWSSEVKQALTKYQWPGNVGEFKHIVQQSMLLARSAQVDLTHLPPDILNADPKAETTSTSTMVLPPEGIDLEALERNLIQQALTIAKGNKAHAARLLGLSRATLLYRIDKYRLMNNSP